MTAPEASVRKMSDRDAASHAVGILEMYAQLCAMNGPDVATAPRLRVVGGEDYGSAGDVPAFLSRA
jgi:hypothetical protein